MQRNKRIVRAFCRWLCYKQYGAPWCPGEDPRASCASSVYNGFFLPSAIACILESVQRPEIACVFLGDILFLRFFAWTWRLPLEIKSQCWMQPMMGMIVRILRNKRLCSNQKRNLSRIAKKRRLKIGITGLQQGWRLSYKCHFLYFSGTWQKYLASWFCNFGRLEESYFRIW